MFSFFRRKKAESASNEAPVAAPADLPESDAAPALLLGLKKEGGVPAVNKSDIVQLEIPVPSLEEQKRIVTILDKFDTLTNSITEGLPREIELRQKQYAYYRDLLFNFPKPEAASAASA